MVHKDRLQFYTITSTCKPCSSWHSRDKRICYCASCAIIISHRAKPLCATIASALDLLSSPKFPWSDSWRAFEDSPGFSRNRGKTHSNSLEERPPAATRLLLRQFPKVCGAWPYAGSAPGIPGDRVSSTRGRSCRENLTHLEFQVRTRQHKIGVVTPTRLNKSRRPITASDTKDRSHNAINRMLSTSTVILLRIRYMENIFRFKPSQIWLESNMPLDLLWNAERLNHYSEAM